MPDVLIHIYTYIWCARAVGMVEPLRNGGALGYMAHKEGGGPLCLLSISLLSLSLSLSLSIREGDGPLCPLSIALFSYMIEPLRYGRALEKRLSCQHLYLFGQLVREHRTQPHGV
jgi:hypothetical protein